MAVVAVGLRRRCVSADRHDGHIGQHGRVELTGILMWDLTECAELLEGVAEDELMRLPRSAERQSREAFQMTATVVYLVVPPAWQAVRGLLTRLSLGEAARLSWDLAQEARNKATGLIPEGPWPPGLRAEELADALAFSLSLDPETVEAECEMPWDLTETVELVARVERRLDRFERRVNHRGNWPR